MDGSPRAADLRIMISVEVAARRRRVKEALAGLCASGAFKSCTTRHQQARGYTPWHTPFYLNDGRSGLIFDHGLPVMPAGWAANYKYTALRRPPLLYQFDHLVFEGFFIVPGIHDSIFRYVTHPFGPPFHSKSFTYAPRIKIAQGLFFGHQRSPSSSFS